MKHILGDILSLSACPAAVVLGQAACTDPSLTSAGFAANLLVYGASLGLTGMAILKNFEDWDDARRAQRKGQYSAEDIRPGLVGALLRHREKKQSLPLDKNPNLKI